MEEGPPTVVNVLLVRVLYICVKFCLLALLTRDLSQAEKKINVVILSVAQLVSKVIKEKSRGDVSLMKQDVFLSL